MSLPEPSNEFKSNGSNLQRIAIGAATLLVVILTVVIAIFLTLEEEFPADEVVGITPASRPTSYTGLQPRPTATLPNTATSPPPTATLTPSSGGTAKRYARTPSSRYPTPPNLLCLQLPSPQPQLSPPAHLKMDHQMAVVPYQRAGSLIRPRWGTPTKPWPIARIF